MQEKVIPFYSIHFTHQDLLIESLKTIEKRIGRYDYFSADIPAGDEKTRFIGYSKLTNRADLFRYLERIERAIPNSSVALWFSAGYISMQQVVSAWTIYQPDRIFCNKGYYLKQEMMWNGEAFLPLAHAGSEYKQKVTQFFFRSLHAALIAKLR